MQTKKLGANKKVVTFEDANGRTVEQLFSYDTLVVEKTHGKMFLTDKHNYSATTSKHVNEFLGLTNDGKKKMLASGFIAVTSKFDRVTGQISSNGIAL